MFINLTKVYYPADYTSPPIFTESEEGYSLLPDQKEKHYSLYKDYIVYYTINSQGIRSIREYAIDKSKSTKRIFVLGDSLAFGIGVNDNETLPSRLEQKLNNSLNTNTYYEVLNLGVTGYTFDNSYVRFKKYISLKPDIIIFVIAGVNDFLDILDSCHEWVNDKNGDILAVKEKCRHINQYHRFVNGPQRFYKKSLFIIEKIIEFLRKHSVTYAFLGTLRHRNKAIISELAKIERAKIEEEGIGRSIQVLEKFFDLTAKNNIKVIFILEFFKDNETTKSNFLNYIFKKTDLIIDMDNFGEVKGLYLPGDGHWSAFGNRYIADFIFEFLQDKKII